jgi:hypothetical protein
MCVSSRFCALGGLAHCVGAGTLGLAPMPTADANLLPPPFASSSLEDEPHSVRSLDAVGVGTVLGAMIEHRRASQPCFASVVVPNEVTESGVVELSDDDLDEDIPRDREPARVPATSEVFLKAR